MNQRVLLACWSLCLIVGLGRASTAHADDLVPMDDRSQSIHYGVAPGATPDTLYVLGGPVLNSGKFQDASGTLPDRQGWIGIDLTQRMDSHWNISAFNAETLDPMVPGNRAMWCGDTFTSCGPTDPPQGYGNNWEEWLDWYGTVPDPYMPTVVTVTAVLNHDLELDYDYLQLEVEWVGNMVPVVDDQNPLTGKSLSAVVFDTAFTVDSSDYVGPSMDQVHLRWRVQSGPGWSDEDCHASGSGACQIDNISVSFDGVLQTYDDFEAGSLVNWIPTLPSAAVVGDFSFVW
jgi:hypothetical protein